MQHVTSLSFLLLAYSNYLSHSHKVVSCGGGGVSATPALLRHLAKRQVRARAMTYMYITYSANICRGILVNLSIGVCQNLMNNWSTVTLLWSRSTTFLGIIRWECPTWWGTARATLRGSTTGRARCRPYGPIRPALGVRRGPSTSSARTRTRTCWWGRWSAGPTWLTPSPTPGLSSRRPSPPPTSTPHSWAS